MSAARQRPPEGGAPKPFTIPEGESWALTNGLRVTLVPYRSLPRSDYKTPLVQR